MPVSEFHRAASKTHLESTQTEMPDHSSFMPYNDFAELLWENGPIVMQGQSNRQKKSSCFPSQNLKLQEKDGRDAAINKFGQFEAIDTELSPAVPCANIGLNNQDDDINANPWMNFPIEDPLCSEFFSELAGINPNTRSAASKDLSNVENGNTSKLKTNNLFQSPVLSNKLKTQQGQFQKHEALPASKPSHASNSFGMMNFSHFSRPGLLARANNESLDRLKEKEKMSSATASTNLMESTVLESSGLHNKSKSKGELEENRHQNHQEAAMDNHRNDNKNYNVTLHEYHTNNQSTSYGTDKGPEAIVASSSVCSGNSAGAASNDPKNKEKRKIREGEESGYHTEDLDDDSTGLKKPTVGKGSTGTKRSRAAEVHNLSERRRRDRINEKMRALQELIPNCNKVDKASMLDEAIEYLKTLQLQVQMMSMGSGLYMSPMMLPPGMHHLRAQMAHFSPMGMGMGMGMNYPMGMIDMNGIPIPPMHTSQFPCHSMPGFGIPGHGQGMPMSMPRAPMFNPLNCIPPREDVMNEVPLQVSEVGTSLRFKGQGQQQQQCLNLEATQKPSNIESQAHLVQLSNAGNSIDNTEKGSSR